MKIILDRNGPTSIRATHTRNIWPFDFEILRRIACYIHVRTPHKFWISVFLKDGVRVINSDRFWQYPIRLLSVYGLKVRQSSTSTRLHIPSTFCSRVYHSHRQNRRSLISLICTDLQNITLVSSGQPLSVVKRGSVLCSLELQTTNFQL